MAHRFLETSFINTQSAEIFCMILPAIFNRW